MRFQAQCYRAHDPRWAFAPLSGTGAARNGGRFNPIGMEALYLGLTLEGAVREASQNIDGKMEPLTLCLYEVDCEDIVDLRTSEGAAAASVAPDDLAAPWMADRIAGRKPASWTLAERLFEKGAAGILVPSFALRAVAGDANLVLWRWGSELPHRVMVHDPAGRLPSDQLSWPSR